MSWSSLWAWSVSAVETDPGWLTLALAVTLPVDSDSRTDVDKSPISDEW